MIEEIENLITLKKGQAAKNQDEIGNLYESIQGLEESTDKLRQEIEKLTAALEVIKDNRPLESGAKSEAQLEALPEKGTDITPIEKGQPKPTIAKESLSKYKKQKYNNKSYTDIIRQALEEKGAMTKKGLVIEIFDIPNGNTQPFEATINSSLWLLHRDRIISSLKNKGKKYYKLIEESQSRQAS